MWEISRQLISQLAQVRIGHCYREANYFARQLISQLAQVRIGHCYREANYCADFLVRTGALQVSSFILYQDPPVDLLELISSDKAGMCCNRTIPELAVSL